MRLKAGSNWSSCLHFTQLAGSYRYNNKHQPLQPQQRSNIEQQQHPQNCLPCLLMTQTNRLKRHSNTRQRQQTGAPQSQNSITSSYLVAHFAGPIQYRQPRLRPFRPHDPFTVLDQHCVYPLLLRLGQRSLANTGRQSLRT